MVMVKVTAIACDPNTWVEMEGDAALSSNAPSYTIVSLIRGEAVVAVDDGFSVFCPSSDDFWLQLPKN